MYKKICWIFILSYISSISWELCNSYDNYFWEVLLLYIVYNITLRWEGLYADNLSTTLRQRIRYYQQGCTCVWVCVCLSVPVFVCVQCLGSMVYKVCLQSLICTSAPDPINNLICGWTRFIRRKFSKLIR